jgi:hypothetical protein
VVHGLGDGRRHGAQIPYIREQREAAAELGGWDRGALEDDPNRLTPQSTPRS